MRLVLLETLVAVGISGALHIAEAGIGTTPASGLVEVASQADVIVVGLVEQQENSGPNYVQVTLGGDAVLGLRIERVLKGDSVGATLTCVWRPWTGAPLSFVGAYGLWFLAVEPGGLRLLPVSSSALSPWEVGVPLPSGPLPEADRYTPGAALVDKLVVELRVATMSSDAGTVSLAYLALSNLLYRGLHRGSRLTYHHIEAPGAEDKTNCPTARLVTEFDGIVVAHLERLMAGKAGTSIPYGLVSALRAVSDPATVPGLARLLERPLCRRCVAEALRNIHSGEALPLLVALLDDPDLDIQYIAVMGLGGYANGDSPGVSGTDHGPGPLATDATRRHSPSVDLFLSDPNTYVAFWKAWWRGQNKAAPVGH